VFETFRAINAHDLDRVRATLHDDFVYHDHRRTGLGRIERVDDYVASLRPLFEGTRDFSTDDLYHVAAEEHGSLAIGRTFGTLAEGGEFESVFARLLLYRDGRLGAVELFEPEHLDAARARFEELRPRTSPAASSDRTNARGAS
jgi:ketosteroid isomerase-like protein